MNGHLSILKFASKFADKKDHRQIIKHVFVKHDTDGSLQYCATDGAIACRVTRKRLGTSCGKVEAYSVDIIDKAHKVKMIDLLGKPELGIEYPFRGVERQFNHDELEPCKTSTLFDCDLLAKCYTALTALRKELKLKVFKVQISPQIKNKASIMRVTINEGLEAETRIELALMPLNY